MSGDIVRPEDVLCSLDGLTAVEQLAAIRQAVAPMLADQAACFAQQIKPGLEEHGVYLLSWSDLTDAERQEATRRFREEVFAVLTPLAVDPGHPFPFISNLSESLGVVLQHPDQDVCD